MLRRAKDKNLVEYSVANPRDFCYDRHQKVDDSPYSGEAGMLMKAEPVALAIESLLGNAERQNIAIVATDPAGSLFDQSTARELASFEEVVFLCGHYEGFDERVVEAFATHRLSIGDYVLTGGELPALVMADAVTRLVPGVLGNEASLAADSHSQGLLSAPNYTRPEIWRGIPVPEVLRSGDHQAVARWRRHEALIRTRALRPELLWRARLDKRDLDMLSS